MILVNCLRVVRQSRINITPLYCAVQANGYATPAGLGKLGKKVKKTAAAQKKIVLPVETDAHKLVKYVCGSNIYKEGTDIEIKPDSEYPDWLWSEINVGPPKTLDELDPSTKAYWRKLRNQGLIRNNRISTTRKF